MYGLAFISLLAKVFHGERKNERKEKDPRRAPMRFQSLMHWPFLNNQ